MCVAVDAHVPTHCMNGTRYCVPLSFLKAATLVLLACRSNESEANRSVNSPFGQNFVVSADPHTTGTALPHPSFMAPHAGLGVGIAGSVHDGHGLAAEGHPNGHAVPQHFAQQSTPLAQPASGTSPQKVQHSTMQPATS
jgi:hypothetical protein